MGDFTLKSQFSSTSRTQMVPDKHVDSVQIASLRSTAVPLREQFRCRRLWFFHHDLRAFTTSWLPLPVFVGYRIALFSYLFIWLILHADSRSSTQGRLWLTQITTLSYTLLVIAMGSMAILCSVYAIVYYTRRPKLARYVPKKDFPEPSIYGQDNIPWYVKIVWILYITAATANFLVAVGYWVFVYSPCDVTAPEGNGTTSSQSNSSTSQAPSTTMSTDNCAILDAPNLHVHLINAVFILVDLVVSRVPYQVFHCFYPFIFTFCYSLFSILYWVGGGKDRFGNPYIYETLDYGNRQSFAFAFFLVPSPIFSYAVLCPLALLRDFIYSRISFCYRDVKEPPIHEYEMNHKLSENGTSGANGGGSTL